MFRFLIIYVSLLTTNVALAQNRSLSKDSILNQMKNVASWQIKEFIAGRVTIPKTNWENGALYAGVMALNNVNTDKAYYNFLYGIGESNRWDMGRNRLFADDYCVAQLYTQMYMRYKEPKMVNKWTALADSIVLHQFNESLKVAPNINLREWAWCDALFMGPPSLWWKTSEYLYDKNEHLYYRDSRFFDMKEKNGSKVFWSRGNGWVMGGLVRMMANMPKKFPQRKRYEAQFIEMAEKVASLQQADGSWHASLLDPVTFSEKESSGTGFFCYAMAWGVRNGLLPKKKFMPIIEAAWAALTSSVHPNGKLGYVQRVGDQPGTAGYESTNVYGVGAFLLAGSELYQLNIR
jgi:unsaturated rhamnogalacturonyl hydrolase